VWASFLWEHFLGHFTDVDFVVIGEGERPFLNLVEWMETGGKERDLGAIRGIAYRSKGEIRRNEPSVHVQNLDELPNPAKYFTFQHVCSSRGCPWQCVFCGSPAFWGRRVRFHSVGYFVSQIEMLYRKGVSFFYVSDDTFTMKKGRTIEICKTILDRDLHITWAAICRVNDVDEEVLYWMRKAGCVQISYGVESGSEKIRHFFNKDISTAQILEAFSSSLRMGIMARAYFIYGSPQETWETIQETIDLMMKIKPLSAIFYILDIFPGTALYEGYKRMTGATDDIWLERIEDIMYFETDPSLSREDILGFGKKLRSSFYSSLPKFADAIELLDRKDLYALHADFYSRLAMTFTHGDYALVDTIHDKDQIAEKLYQKALAYHPDHRAYLGLGILMQKMKDYDESIRILSEGLRYFPQSEQLNSCLAHSRSQVLTRDRRAATPLTQKE